MSPEQALTNQILKTLRHTLVCELDALAGECPDFTWNQVFLEVDRLSRIGQIHVTTGGFGTYLIQLPERRKAIASSDMSTRGDGGAPVERRRAGRLQEKPELV